jgi:hypothetical protein
VPAFLPAPEPLPVPADPRTPWTALLLASGTIVAIATMRPWVKVQFERLFGAHDGPPGWQSSAGFTCLCASALVIVMTLAETPARTSHAAVRPASLLLVAVSALTLTFEWLDGPGLLRGVTATWTWAFWIVAIAMAGLLFACIRRAAGVRA